ncbi:MAG: UDP-N-acetylenolpyruvoylglucosamine reductase [Cyanobacteria bacterium QS_8_64_29]|nr:MAG: UDP-N-acetylenolpyruvoylglucosamine reductase [Cyanobacteria bacterium QS_8_64_29]
MAEAGYVPGTDCPLYAQLPLANLTSYRVGGPAEHYFAPHNGADLQASLQWACAQGLPVTVLGAGSNLLIADRGISGLAIATRHLRDAHFDPETGRVTVGAGKTIPSLAWQAAKWGWQGLEWAVGIPGTVGGAVVMNAGAQQGCVADRLVRARLLRPDGQLEERGPEALAFAYRSSNLQGSDWVVVEATFQLQPGAAKDTVVAATRENLQHRKRTQPYHLPSCGSVFRNPEPYAAAALIEQLGLKGYQIGGAQIAQRHANFILNCGDARASDIWQLIGYIQERVEQRWAIRLQREVRLLGEF